MTAGELVVVLAALLLTIGFAALIVVLLRVLDTLRDLRREVTDLRIETRPLIDELRTSAAEARETVDEARHDLERFDKVLGSAEAIGDAVGSRVTKTAFSSPSIKAAGLAKGTSRTLARLRGAPRRSAIDGRQPGVIDVSRTTGAPEQRRKRA
ncbi:DUF948 domain-containing protein [Ilumatobacter coccineus]|uniref:DUF948 domain-containing protein n=1 Tax=Ilumatobacter coccineus (strain NBRC 103263 / KCTC 29153 / YM16-304) TaxID=1313172 RepID=A0A6C7E588_ILUCY|nr:DUF948 domain-containing protein [Ilumatobacter coccineus]BAN02954.1 hypothetical protein YM304_26400 [Ilumatobacter coccineus YM16-304]